MRLTDLADRLEAGGLSVVTVDGWETRGRGTDGGQYTNGRPDRVMWHHTAGATGADAANEVAYMVRYSPYAPVANLYVARNGDIWVMAAGPTNTNGSGGPMPGVSANNMNRHAIGIEIGNNGVGEPYPDAQQDAILRLGHTLIDAYGIGADLHFAHFEWAPGRKVDPAGPARWSDNRNQMWDMDVFRNDLAQGADMPLTDDDVQRIAAAVWAHRLEQYGQNFSAGGWLTRTQRIARYWLGSTRRDDEIPKRTTLQQIERNTSGRAAD